MMEDRSVRWRSGRSLVRRSSQWLSRKKGARGIAERGDKRGKMQRTSIDSPSAWRSACPTHFRKRARTHARTGQPTNALSRFPWSAYTSTNTNTDTWPGCTWYGCVCAHTRTPECVPIVECRAQGTQNVLSLSSPLTQLKERKKRRRTKKEKIKEKGNWILQSPFRAFLLWISLAGCIKN